MPDTPINIFISYAHADSPFVDRLEADLQKQGFDPWVDRQRLVGGVRWRRELQEAVKRAQVLLIVLSPDAVASPNVQIEYDYVLELGKVVIPLYYRQSEVPMELRAIQWVDFRHSYDEGLAALLRALGEQVHLATPTASSAESRPGELKQLSPQQPIGELAPVPAAPPPALAPLVGRKPEWAQLQQLWQQTASGKAQLVVIAGEAGVGKTRLAEELLVWVAHQQNLAWARAACYAVESSLAFAPVSAWLRTPVIHTRLSSLPTLWLTEVARFVPELLVEQRGLPPPGPLTESWQQQRLFEALARAILAARPPLLLLLDDLHWCDRETLNWLHYLLRFDPQARLLILGTVRTEEVTKEHPLQALLTALRREGQLTQINLEGLSANETASLATQVAGRELDAKEVNRLYSETEGNALLVVETVRMGLEEANDARQENPAPSLRGGAEEVKLSPTIQAVIGARLEQLSPEIRELVNVAAVIGRPFSVELLAQASKRDEEVVLDALDDLWQRGIVREAEPEGYDFSHAKIREVAYAELRPPRRRLLHRQVAQALEAVYANRLATVSGQLALHYEQAGEWAKTVQYAQHAGEQAQRVYDPRAAIEQYSRALEAAQKGSLEPPPTVYRLRGQAYETLGNFEPARADYETMLQRGRSAGDSQGEWQALIDLGFLWAQRDYTQAGTYFQQALELAEHMGDLRSRAYTLNRLGNWHLNMGQPQEALRYHQEALATLEGLHDQRGLAETLDLLGIASYMSGDLIQGALYSQQAIVLLRELDDRQRLISSLVTLMLCGGNYQTETLVPAAGGVAESLQHGELALKIAGESGQRSAEAYSMIQMALCLGPWGEYTRGLEVAQRGFAIAQEIEHRQWMGAGQRALGALYFDLLALSEAQQHLEPTLAQAQKMGSQLMILFVSGSLARIYLLLQDFTKADSVLNAALPLDAPSQTLMQRFVWAARAELALARSNPQQALDIIDRLIASAANRSEKEVIPYLWKVRGEALTALGREAEAEAVLQAAQETARAQGLRPLLWRIAVVLGKCYQTLGRKVEAEEAFSTARTVIEELAANVPDEQLREQFLRQATAMLL